MSCHHTEGPGHDCSYVDARNALIPVAQREVLRALGPALDDHDAHSVRYAKDFSRLFFRAMDRLWSEHMAGAPIPVHRGRKHGQTRPVPPAEPISIEID